MALCLDCYRDFTSPREAGGICDACLDSGLTQVSLSGGELDALCNILSYFVDEVEGIPPAAHDLLSGLLAKLNPLAPPLAEEDAAEDGDCGRSHRDVERSYYMEH